MTARGGDVSATGAVQGGPATGCGVTARRERGRKRAGMRVRGGGDCAAARDSREGREKKERAPRGFPQGA